MSIERPMLSQLEQQLLVFSFKRRTKNVEYRCFPIWITRSFIEFEELFE